MAVGAAFRTCAELILSVTADLLWIMDAPQVRIYRAPLIVEHTTPARVQANAVGAQRWIRLCDTSAGCRHLTCREVVLRCAVIGFKGLRASTPVAVGGTFRTCAELVLSVTAVAKEHNIQFVWVKNGRIYLRKKEGEPAIRVHQLSDLERLN
ncbi:hypothetical protein HPB48_013660 [Haemaphysalis longicornis]|uniref:FP protein C-terminal domain-containing protein n=1 Tax=Haemaphysalis longicornis TaxID=44386 RepID=A0A9J6FZW0_HAELO|nr:hypothetical protein HPB48_013660 [Haemaphysalis longicornis]